MQFPTLKRFIVTFLTRRTPDYERRSLLGRIEVWAQYDSDAEDLVKAMFDDDVVIKETKEA